MSHGNKSRLALSLVVLLVLSSAACRAERVEPQSCVAGVVQDKWVERRTPASGAADTTRAALSMTLTSPIDSVDRLPSGTMISLVIAGPVGAERPDTVRLLTAEVAGGALWSGSDLRPGTYSASLTTDGFRAGPHEFVAGPGERVELDVTMGRTCDPPGKQLRARAELVRAAAKVAGEAWAASITPTSGAPSGMPTALMLVTVVGTAVFLLTASSAVALSWGAGSLVSILQNWMLTHDRRTPATPNGG